MELKHIKELMAAMGRTGTKKLLLKKDQFELQLEREGAGKENRQFGEPSEENPMRDDMELHRASVSVSHLEKGGRPSAPPSSFEVAEKEEDFTAAYITSPMVGTLYIAPSPDDPSFVKVGDHVDKDTVVCIVEAMKVMNEVKAGVSGTIAEVLVENGHPVEFGTKLFRVT